MDLNKIVLGVLISARIMTTGSAFAALPDNPTACFLVFVGSENTTTTSISCDGSSAEKLPQKSKVMLEEQSAQTAHIIKKTGLRLVSCQMTSSPKDRMMEIFCTLGK